MFSSTKKNLAAGKSFPSPQSSKRLKAAFPTKETGAQLLRVTLDSVSALCGGLAPTGVLVRTSRALQRAQATESSESTCLHQAAAAQTGFCSKFVTWLSRRFGSSGSIWIQCYPSSEGQYKLTTMNSEFRHQLFSSILPPDSLGVCGDLWHLDVVSSGKESNIIYGSIKSQVN